MKKKNQTKKNKEEDGFFLFVMQGIFVCLEMLVNFFLYTIKGIGFLIKKFREKKYKV